MFRGAGSAMESKKKVEGTLADALTVVADKLSGAMSPHSPGSTTSRISAACSPARLIENRSKCYKQLSKLNTLKSSGVLTEVEYMSEKDGVMKTLKTLLH